MPRLLNFYRGEDTDSEGRFLNDIWAWGDGELEEVHDFIQWLFPLPEPSPLNPNAPLLAEDDTAVFREDQLLQAYLRKSFERILTFLELTMDQKGKVVERSNFMARARGVWAYPNPNWLRITRILRSLRLLGLGTESLPCTSGWKRFTVPASSQFQRTHSVSGRRRRSGSRFMVDEAEANSGNLAGSIVDTAWTWSFG